MGGPFMFTGGVIALIASFSSGCVEDNRHGLQNEEFWKGGYNLSLQMNRYDGNFSYLSDHYDYEKVMKEIEKEYPRMSPVNMHKLALMAMAKRLMEEETPYNYHVSEMYRFLGDIERFANDNCKVKH